MERLIISKNYPKKFVYTYIPRVFKQLAYKKLVIHKKSKMNKYLVDNYQLGIADIYPLLNKIRIAEYKSFYIMHYDIDDRLKNKNRNHVREIFHVLCYGNLEVRGLHVIDGAFDYIAGNITSLYNLYVLEENALIQMRKKRKDMKVYGNKILRRSSDK